MATVAGVQAVALQDAEAVSWDALPRDALVRVLGHLAGDVEALCASACVARAWRDAASEPTLWAQLQVLSEEVAARMTDANLLGLVVRARGGLEQLDISGAQNVTEEGLMAALQQPHALVVFQADRDCRGLSPQGVARALAAQNGRMRVLSVRGLDCGPEMESVELPEGVLEGMLAALRALLAPEGILDGDHLCDTCTRLCCETDDFCTTDDCQPWRVMTARSLKATVRASAATNCSATPAWSGRTAKSASGSTASTKTTKETKTKKMSTSKARAGASVVTKSA
jgi:hypothetical protein